MLAFFRQGGPPHFTARRGHGRSVVVLRGQLNRCSRKGHRRLRSGTMAQLPRPTLSRKQESSLSGVHGLQAFACKGLTARSKSHAAVTANIATSVMLPLPALLPVLPVLPLLQPLRPTPSQWVQQTLTTPRRIFQTGALAWTSGRQE